jgi:predicted amidohydrolase
MKIALLQTDIFWESKEKNIEKAEFYLEKAFHNNCDIAVLPEMFTTGFSMNISKIAEDENSFTNRALKEFAKKYRMYLVAGYVIKDKSMGKGRNVAVIYNRKGQKIALYTKIHPFSYAKENKYYLPGEDVAIFKIDNIPSSVFICYDLRFPEIFRKVAKNVYVIFVIANWPFSRIEHWNTLLKARAIENQCYVVGVNRVGIDGNNITYNGSSQIISPLGEIIVKANEKERLMFGEIYPEIVKETRMKFPFLKDIKKLSII